MVRGRKDRSGLKACLKGFGKKRGVLKTKSQKKKNRRDFIFFGGWNRTLEGVRV